MDFLRPTAREHCWHSTGQLLAARGGTAEAAGARRTLVPPRAARRRCHEPTTRAAARRLAPHLRALGHRVRRNRAGRGAHSAGAAHEQGSDVLRLLDPLRSVAESIADWIGLAANHLCMKDIAFKRSVLNLLSLLCKYPPAEPGALGIEPLKAAEFGAAEAAPRWWLGKFSSSFVPPTWPHLHTHCQLDLGTWGPGTRPKGLPS